jgi:hypothetical protein
MPALTPHITAQLSIMAGRGMSVEQMAAGLGLSPAEVETELRWLGLAAVRAPPPAPRAPAQGPGAHYAVEVEIGAGGWLRRKERFGLASEARREAEDFRRAGGAARVIRVMDDGTRRVVG